MKFDDWMLAQIDDRTEMDGHPVPLLTTLLYKVCDGDKLRFEEAIYIIRKAYEGGQANGL